MTKEKWVMAIDAGAYEVKGRTKDEVFKFRSAMGPYRQLKVSNVLNKDIVGSQEDFIIEYNDETMYLGDIAVRECHILREPKHISKAHDETKIRVLVAVHQYGKKSGNLVVVGQPIQGLTPNEKESIVDMLKDIHTITVNGEKKTFSIDDVKVVGEAAGAYFSIEERPEMITNVIDAGSSTFNYLRVEDGFFIDRKSGTLNYGTETDKNITHKQMVDAIISTTKGKWNSSDPTFLAGGVAGELLPHFQDYFNNIQLIEPVHFKSNYPEKHPPQFANAFGFYLIGKTVFLNE
ncbi:ParM/StbA family protein [Cytobacillus suaedae]|nr:ParM/StbA family protein [Cytobacillus suaedae]